MMKEFKMFASDKNENLFLRYSLFEPDFKLFRILEELDKIYVAKESEHIFEPKKHDLAGFTRDDGISTIAQYDEAKKAFINGSFRILKKYNPKIIMRDNKQFFMPEVEND